MTTGLGLIIPRLAGKASLLKVVWQRRYVSALRPFRRVPGWDQESMTNDQARMTKEIPMTKFQNPSRAFAQLGYLSFVILSSLGFRHSSFSGISPSNQNSRHVFPANA